MSERNVDRSQHLFCAGFMALLFTLLPLVAVGQDRSISYHRIRVGDYQNFVVNWDEQKHPVLYAFIQTPTHYDALFHPAPTNFSLKSTAPDPSLFASEEILLVARVTPTVPDMNAVFEVDKVSDNGRVLTLHYRFQKPTKQTSSFVKDYLAVRIPKRTYDRVVFVENGQQIGELNLSAGQWSVPQVELDPDALRTPVPKP
jgi:hypothetical protein